MAKKLDSNTNASMKLLGLFSLLLFSGRKFSLKELAERFKCSKQTILRLIDEITVSYDLPLKVQIERQGRENLYWAVNSQKPLNVSLRPESIQKLLLCRDIVYHLLPQSFRDEVDGTIEKAACLLDDYGQKGSALTSYAAGVPKGRIDYSKHQDMIKSLIKCINKNLVCSAQYHAPKHDKPKEYLFVPQQLAAYRDALYIRGYSYPKGEEKTFAIHRFQAVEPTSIQSKLKPPASSCGYKPFGFMHGEPFRLKVEFMPPVAAYVAERLWSEDQKLEQKPNGNVVLSFSATDKTEVLAWILSFGQRAKILEPKELYSTFKIEIEHMTSLYNS